MDGDQFLWVSILCLFGNKTLEYRGQVARVPFEELIRSGQTSSRFLRLSNAYVVNSNDDDEAEILRYGGRHPMYASATGECYLRVDTICYADILKDGDEYDEAT